jgi:L-alanine-DL-glutamate epimerase-like enolase superfamily enzyme
MQPSVIKVGGVSECRKIAALAEVYNAEIAFHSPYFGPGLLATVHLIAATACARWLEVFYMNLEAHVFKDFPKVRNGLFPIPQGQGIGLEIDPEVLDQYRVSI